MMTRRLTHIITYPIKSLGGVHHEQATLTGRGLQYDRRWMLIDERHHFLTIRQHPEFLSYDVSMSNDGFKVARRGESETISIPFKVTGGEAIKVNIWKDIVDAIAANKSINDWFARQLGFSCRLVYLPDHAPRRVQPEWVAQEHHVSFADGYPYLIMGEESIIDIDRKAQDAIDYRRFRPNFVYTGGVAYEEYYFENVAIGTAAIKCIKPCTRCIVTTMHPITGTKGKEPLKTLYQQRINDKMVAGQNAILQKEGVVKSGDELIIESTKSTPYTPVHF